MSSRPTYRGVRNQWPRGYSSRPTGGGYGGGDQFVSGDSHHQSVREANQGFQPRSNYGNQSGFRPSYNRTPPPAYYAPPPFTYPPPPNYAPPAFNQNQQFRPPQQFRPRPQKPMDHRNWEFVKPGPPPQCERFTVLSYNILADYLAINHRGKLYSHIPWRMLDWEWRTRNILFELGLWSADVLCFQEVDRFQDLEEQLRVQGYSGIWKMRTGVAVDGCAIFWRASRFKLIYEEGVEFNKLGLRDNVAQICVLESLNQSSGNNNNVSEQAMSLPGVNRVVICNIHVLYNPKRGEIKLGQVRVLLSRAHAVSKLWDDAPVVLCGDFNCTPKSPLYNYISEQKLDLSDLPRDEISGQASAQMYQTRPFNPNFRGAGASSAAGPSMGASNREVSCVNSVVGFKDDISSAINSVSGENSSSQINAGSDVSDTSSISRQEGNDLEKETRQAVDRNDVAKEDDAFPSMSDSIESNSMDSIINQRMENLSLIEFPEINVEDETTGKESSMFLSELHGKNSSFSSEVSVTARPDFVESSSKSMEEPASPPMSQEDEVPGDNSGYINGTRFVYDPSAWTPAEICTATGDADCKYLDHPLKLRSTYTEIEDSQGTRDSNGEPQVTSYNRCFIGTVDYIWRSEGLETVKVLAPIPKHAMMWTPGYPTKKWGSDHIALVSELAFTKEEARYGLK